MSLATVSFLGLNKRLFEIEGLFGRAKGVSWINIDMSDRSVLRGGTPLRVAVRDVAVAEAVKI
jgi:hypothetical protein